MPVRPPRRSRWAAWSQLHLRHGAVRPRPTYLVPVFMQIALHLPPTQGRRGAAAGGLCARADDSGREPARRSRRDQPHRRAPACCCSPPRSSLMLDSRAIRDVRSALDHAVGRDRPCRPRLRVALAQPRLDARACPNALRSRTARARSTSCASSAARSASAWSASCFGVAPAGAGPPRPAARVPRDLRSLIGAITAGDGQAVSGRSPRCAPGRRPPPARARAWPRIRRRTEVLAASLRYAAASGT